MRGFEEAGSCSGAPGLSLAGRPNCLPSLQRRCGLRAGFLGFHVAAPSTPQRKPLGGMWHQCGRPHKAPPCLSPERPSPGLEDVWAKCAEIGLSFSPTDADGREEQSQAQAAAGGAQGPGGEGTGTGPASVEAGPAGGAGQVHPGSHTAPWQAQGHTARAGACSPQSRRPARSGARLSHRSPPLPAAHGAVPPERDVREAPGAFPIACHPRAHETASGEEAASVACCDY